MPLHPGSRQSPSTRTSGDFTVCNLGGRVPEMHRGEDTLQVVPDDSSADGLLVWLSTTATNQIAGGPSVSVTGGSGVLVNAQQPKIGIVDTVKVNIAIPDGTAPPFSITTMLTIGSGVSQGTPIIYSNGFEAELSRSSPTTTQFAWGKAINNALIQYAPGVSQHLTLVVEKTNIGVYQDGVKTMNYPVVDNPSMTGGLSVGGVGSGTGIDIGNFGFWNRALTDGEAHKLVGSFDPTVYLG